jgi:hypothetical protein
LVLWGGEGIKPKCTTVKNPQVNALVEWGHQVIQNMIHMKGLTNCMFDYINPWDEILSSVAWAISASYHSSSLTSLQQRHDFRHKTIVYLRSITTCKQKLINLDNDWESSSQIDHKYSIGNLIYFCHTGIKHK